MEKEIWKDVVGYASLFRVSNYGRVFRLDRQTTHKNKLAQYRNVTYKYKGGFVKQHTGTGTNYLCVALRKNGNYKIKYVHRLVAESFIPNLYNKEEVNHIDFNRKHNFYKNLEWVTRQENLNWSNANGRTPKGENHWNSKLTKSQVIKIRKLYKKKTFNQPELAKMFNLHQTTIHYILINKLWRDVA